MILEKILTAAIEENTYLWAPGPKGGAVIVDPGEPREEFGRFLSDAGLHVELIFLTHGHHDHVGGALAVRDAHGGKIVAHKADDFDADVVLEGDGALPFSGGDLRVLHVPGHTPGQCALYVPGVLFSGDILFAGAVGGTGNPEDYRRQIDGIRDKILVLPASTRVCPGHGPDTTLEIEKAFNPFLTVLPPA